MGLFPKICRWWNLPFSPPSYILSFWVYNHFISSKFMIFPVAEVSQDSARTGLQTATLVSTSGSCNLFKVTLPETMTPMPRPVQRPCLRDGQGRGTRGANSPFWMEPWLQSAKQQSWVSSEERDTKPSNDVFRLFLTHMIHTGQWNP